MGDPLLSQITRVARRLRIEDPDQEAAIALWLAREALPRDADEALIVCWARRNHLNRIARRKRVELLLESPPPKNRRLCGDALKVSRALAVFVAADQERGADLRMICGMICGSLAEREARALHAWAQGSTTVEIGEAIGTGKSQAAAIVSRVLSQLARSAAA